MPETTVVHVRDVDLADPDVVYIGRVMPRQRIKASPYANPFKIAAPHPRTGQPMTREDALTEYREWVLHSEDPRAVWIREHTGELDGKRLACWCHPDACHGDVLKEMAGEPHA